MFKGFSRFTGHDCHILVRIYSLLVIRIFYFDCFCSYGTVPQKIEFPFPLYINKFLEKAEMDSNNFFLRWRNLDKPGQECQKIFAAKHPMNHDDIRQKVDHPSNYLIKTNAFLFL